MNEATWKYVKYMATGALSGFSLALGIGFFPPVSTLSEFLTYESISICIGALAGGYFAYEDDSKQINWGSCSNTAIGAAALNSITTESVRDNNHKEN